MRFPGIEPSRLKDLFKDPPWRTKSRAATTNEYSIGIYVGNSPYEFRSAENIKNPVLTWRDVLDVPSRFVADPFMLRKDEHWFMFFEVLNKNTLKGEIGMATSQNGFDWTYQQIVLSEPFHLSYPYVFEWMDQYYMIPESHKSRSIRLYRAASFPFDWVFLCDLLTGPYYVDTSVCHYGNSWWLFTENNPAFKHDTLRLYYAPELNGPWIEHPQSPVINRDPHIARPAGRIVVIDNRIFRYAQDCYPHYGTRVRAFEVTELTPERYSERQACDIPILSKGAPESWNSFGMHHIDALPIGENRWIACVDGHRKVSAIDY
jgi:hypothetical protein